MTASFPRGTLTSSGDAPFFTPPTKTVAFGGTVSIRRTASTSPGGEGGRSSADVIAAGAEVAAVGADGVVVGVGVGAPAAIDDDGTTGERVVGSTAPRVNTTRNTTIAPMDARRSRPRRMACLSGSFFERRVERSILSSVAAGDPFTGGPSVAGDPTIALATAFSSGSPSAVRAMVSGRRLCRSQSNSMRQRKSRPKLPTEPDDTVLMLSYEV